MFGVNVLKICTVYFKGFYTPDYVSKLYRSLKRNSTVPFEFICLSDTDVEADLVLPYNHHGNIKKHWHKLKFFSPQFTMDNVELNKIYSKKFNTDYMILDDVNEKIKVVHFTGVGKTIHEHRDNFIKRYWQ